MKSHHQINAADNAQLLIWSPVSPVLPLSIHHEIDDGILRNDILTP